jgi:translation elongation factor EF-Ts
MALNHDRLPAEITYTMVRAVRDETGASHADCRRMLGLSQGDVDRAVSLWFTEKRCAGVQRGQLDR